MKILSIVGTRRQFTKASVIGRVSRESYQAGPIRAGAASYANWKAYR